MQDESHAWLFYINGKKSLSLLNDSQTPTEWNPRKLQSNIRLSPGSGSIPHFPVNCSKPGTSCLQAFASVLPYGQTYFLLSFISQSHPIQHWAWDNSQKIFPESQINLNVLNLCFVRAFTLPSCQQLMCCIWFISLRDSFPF